MAPADDTSAPSDGDSDDYDYNDDNDDRLDSEWWWPVPTVESGGVDDDTGSKTDAHAGVPQPVGAPWSLFTPRSMLVVAGPSASSCTSQDYLRNALGCGGDDAHEPDGVLLDTVDTDALIPCSAPTSSARHVLLSADVLLLACDANNVNLVRTILDQAETGDAVFANIAFRRYPLSIDPRLSLIGDGYEPDEDDLESWLAPMTILDRVVERGFASIARLLVKKYAHHDPSGLPVLSERARANAKKYEHSTRYGSRSHMDVALAYLASFAGNGETCLACLEELGWSNHGGESDAAARLSKPLSIAISRGAAGVAAALIRAGASVEDFKQERGANSRAGGLRLAFSGAHNCERPLCVAARTLANPTVVGILLLKGAKCRHPNRVDDYAAASDARGLSATVTALPADGVHLPVDSANASLDQLRRDIALGVVDMPEGCPTLQLASDARDVLARATAGVSLVWSEENHAKHPHEFRAGVREMLKALYCAPLEGTDDCAGSNFEFANHFRRLGEPSLRGMIIARMVARLARTCVWPELPLSLWDPRVH